MFIEVARKRRSIRSYLPRPVEPDKVEILVEAALRAPCSRGDIQWEFIVVTDRDLLARLSKAKPHGASFLKDAPLGMVVCADPSKGDVWVEDAAIATTYLHLAATSLGLGSCWIQIRGRRHDDEKTSSAYIAELLDLPSNLEVEAMVAIGYPAKEAAPHPTGELPYRRVSYNRYGQKG